jgi:hypothetical protein
MGTSDLIEYCLFFVILICYISFFYGIYKLLLKTSKNRENIIIDNIVEENNDKD